MSKDCIFHAGEATVLAREGQELIANRHAIRHGMDDWS
jgi:hypothetical protein